MAEITVTPLISPRIVLPKGSPKAGYLFIYFFYNSDILKNKSSEQAGSLLFDVVRIPSWSRDL